MKNILLFAALLFCFQVSAQRKPKIKGSRIVTDVQENLPPFNTIELNDDLEVRLRKAPQEGYAITADDNLIDVLKFKVEDSVLIISSFYDITAKKKLDITVNYSDIDVLTLRNGDIRMDGAIITNGLDVNLSESAKLQLNAEAPRMAIYMEGTSSGDFTLKGDEINFVLKDRADARIYAVSETNDLKMNGNASAKMEGTVGDFTINLFENSSLKGEGMESEKVLANLQGSSSAEVHVKMTIELTSSGSSKTYVYGDGKIEIIEFLDTSELHREK
ncbi:GIN domain-containing protein [Pricia sp.]|uniref:GIN domain-containing protein n=1 Tax=Pricia sp. TaxID=2268138 RepID=UPI003594708C